MRSRKQSGKRAWDEVNVYQCSNAMTTLSSSCLKLCSECVQEATAILKQLYNGPQTWLVKQPIQHALRVASVAAIPLSLLCQGHPQEQSWEIVL